MRVAVVGGGIAGLTAAWRLRAEDVVVFEGTDRVGGKLRLDPVGDVSLDVGAESMLARRPEAVGLCAELGLDVVHPETTSAAVWTGGELLALPPTVMGIPRGDSWAHPEQHSVPLPERDISIAEYVRARVGDDVLQRLVEPLLGGVYAGHADRLSLAAAGAQLLALGADPLTAAAQIGAAQMGESTAPVFAGLAGGIGQLPQVIAERSGADVRLGVRVIGLERDGADWLIRTTHGDERADAVVVATPTPASARLLAGVAPRAAYQLADVELASVAIVTFVFDRDLALSGSGFLVPPADGRTIKGSTFSSNKWGWLAEPGRTVLRASVGRAGETVLLHTGDDDVAATVLTELAEAVGPLPAPVASHVRRWGGALPQYEVGHLDRLAAIDADIAALPGLEVCGAAYRGVGIPAVIADATGAVERMTA